MSLEPIPQQPTPATPAPVPVAATKTKRVRRYARWLIVGLVVLTLGGVWQRERVWLWYCAERLERASDDDQAEWGAKLAAIGEPAIPTLLKCFQHDSPSVCNTGRRALEAIVGVYADGDPRLAAFAEQYAAAEPRFSTPGRSAAMDLVPVLIAKKTPGMAEKAHALIEHAAKSESVDLRVQAIALAMRPEVDGLHAVLPLLRDPAVEVRRAAILALGPITRTDRVAAADDDLLRLLHDSDGEVRQLCEMSLRSRGRSPRDIRLGKRYAAPNPAERQKLLIDLANDDERDLSVWLDRLTADADPAVRAGAVRVAAERNVDLATRLEEMRRTDPDGAVRRIADYYHKKLVDR